MILGEPSSGLSMKLWLNRPVLRGAMDMIVGTLNVLGSGEKAIDFAVGLRTSDYLYFHTTLLNHSYNMIKTSDMSGKMPVYWGSGFRYKKNRDISSVGLKFSIGIEYMPESAPIDVFAELVPVFNVTPKFELEITAGFGVRYMFEL
jgi:hypothetical protein